MNSAMVVFLLVGLTMPNIITANSGSYSSGSGSYSSGSGSSPGTITIPNCIEVSVLGDATYCIEGPICSGSGLEPQGLQCPVKGDVAIADCHNDLASYIGNGRCEIPTNVNCQLLKTGAWGCVLSSSDNHSSSGMGAEGPSSNNSSSSMGAEGSSSNNSSSSMGSEGSSSFNGSSSMGSEGSNDETIVALSENSIASGSVGVVGAVAAIAASVAAITGFALYKQKRRALEGSSLQFDEGRLESFADVITPKYL